MKKTRFKLIWMFVFFVIGTIVFAIFIGGILPWSFHDDKAAFHEKAVFCALVGLICLIGLPGLALILSTRGVLPGTRHKRI